MSTTSIASYQLGECIGEGGAARVFRATTADGREVALKLIDPGAPGREHMVQVRFEREVAALQRLRHPNLLELLDHGVDPEMGPYIVTPLIPGRTLRDLFAAGRLLPESALLLVQPLLEGLAAMHEARLIHRDLKPDNVMVGRDGRVIIVDLGLAHHDENTRCTEEGAVAGSAPYMSPEQIEANEITAASDVWSVGIILFELVIGKRPFQRPRLAEEVAAILAGVHDRLDQIDRRVSERLAEVIESCLRYAPGERPADARALLARLEPELDGTDPVALERDIAALVQDRTAHEKQLAQVRTRLLTREAAAAIDSSDSFRAVRLLDRALAYDPADADALQLVERAVQLDPGPATAAPAVRTEPPPSLTATRRRTAPLFATLVAVISVGAVAVVPQWSRRVRGTPASVDVARVIPPARAVTPDDYTNTDPPIAFEHDPIEPIEISGVPAPSERAAYLAAIERRLALHPDDRDADLARAAVLLSLGRSAEGTAILERLSRSNPEVFAAHRLLAHVGSRLHRLDLADEGWSRLLARSPEDIEALRERGAVRRRLGHTRDAIVDLTMALRLRDTDAFALREAAEIHAHAGHLREARTLLSRLIAVAPEAADAWLDLSIVQDDPRDALGNVRRALAIAPDDTAANARLCGLLARTHAPDALAGCDRALSLSPTSAQILNDRALAREYGHDSSHALADLDSAIALRGSEPAYRVNRARILLAAGRTDAARGDLREACRLGLSAACPP